MADAYVEVRLGDGVVARTHVCQRSLNPVWDCDFRIDVTDDSTLQDELLELRVFDFDVVTSNDIIGTVLVDMNPLLMSDKVSQVSGWFPIYDSFRGICGELHAVVKLQYLGDINPFREVGVPLYSTSQPPQGFRIAHVAGFVEELFVESDPEYHWSDPFRTMRSSNEERQLTLSTLSAKVRRMLGRKAVDAGANAVLAVHCALDLDAECVVGRACGTAVRLVRVRVCCCGLLSFMYTKQQLVFVLIFVAGSSPTHPSH